MKGLYGCAWLILLTFTSFGQSISSAQSGAWNESSTWTGGVIPDASNSDQIQIFHSVIVPNAYSVVADQIVVNSGGVLEVEAGGSLTVADDGTAAADLDLYNDGFDYGFLTVGGTLICGDLAVISGADQGNTTFEGGSIFRLMYTNTEGSIPYANWDINSTVQISGYTLTAFNITASAAGNWSQSFGNFEFNCNLSSSKYFDFAGLLTTIQNDLIIAGTGSSTGNVRLSSTQNPTINIGRDFVISGQSRVLFGSGTATVVNVARDFIYSSSHSSGTNLTTDGKTTVNVNADFSMNAPGGKLIFASGGSGNGVLNILGDFDLIKGTLDENNSLTTGNVNFIGSGIHTFTNTGSIVNAINFSVSSLSTLDLGVSAITGTGTFTLNGTLRLGSTEGGGALQSGTLAGNIRTSGARTYSSNATIVYNGTDSQFIGNGFPSGGDVNLSIDNASGVTLSTSLDIVALRTLNLASGNIIIGSQTLTINGTVTGDGGIVGGSTSNLVIGGTGDFGILTFNGTNDLLNFTLDRTGSGLVTLGGDLTVLGAFTHTNGTLAIADNTLTISGDYLPLTPAPLSVATTSSIIVDGTGDLPSDVAFSGTELGTLTLNRASSVLATSSTLAIQNLNLLSGTFDNGSGISISAGGTITRQGGTSAGEMTSSPTNTTVSYNVIYTSGAMSTGPELPSNATALDNLSKTGSGTLTLGSPITVNGDLTLSSGLFDAGANSIALKGNFVANAGSVLTNSAFTFSGTTTVSGSGTPTFGTVAITGTLTPSSTFQINGNLVNDGTLNASSGTTIFGGSTTISGSSICSFANVKITGTLNAPSNLNVAGSWTNDGTFNRGNAANKVTFTGTTTIGGSASTNFSSIAITGTLNGPSVLTIAGNFTNNGTFNAGTGAVVLNGGTAQSISGTAVTNFYDLTINKASGTATIATNQNLTNALTISNVGGLNANGMLTLVSTATRDARIAQITGGGSITGNITVQRYLPNGDGVRAYRFLSSPVTNAMISDWKAEFPITGTFNDPSTQAEWPAISGIKQTNPSLFIYNEAHSPTASMNDRYESYPYNGTNSTSSPISNGRGYAAFVRQTSPITLNVTGTPRQGNVSVNVTAQSGGGDDGWNLIGNPYAAPIHWDNVNKPAAVNAQIALQDNTDNIGLGAGAYVYYTQNGIGIPASYTGTIASGQAFWVRATANSTITFEENDKEAVSSPDFIREAPTSDILRLNIAGNDSQDEMVIHFASEASDAMDTELDALKLENSFINLSSFSSDSVRMAINVLGALQCNKEVGIALDVAPGQYGFTFSQFESFSDEIRIRLMDNFTGDLTDVNSLGYEYQFEVTDDPSSFGENRFRLFFAYPTVNTSLNTFGLDVCLGADAVVTVENTQPGITYTSSIGGVNVSDPVVGTGEQIQLTIPGSKLSVGENVVVVMASVAGCSAVPMEVVTNIQTDELYKVNSSNITSARSCGEGQVTLGVEGAPEEGSYRWYESADSPTPIEGQQGSTFVTPVLNKTQSYFVSVVNALGCEGPRTEVTAEVNMYDPVSITVGEGILASSYATGNQWFRDGQPIEGATGQSVEVTETGLYEVEARTEAGCSSRASQEMIVLSAEEPFGTKFDFYPNPVMDRLTIEVPYAVQVSGKVLNAQGKSIGTLNFNSPRGGNSSSYFDFGGHSPGIYLIQIQQGTTIIQHKIIKK